MSKIEGKVISGLKWNSLSSFLTKGSDFIVKLILARLLLTEAFGMVGMAMVIIGFMKAFSDMGLYNALIQKKEDDKTQLRYSSAFWFLLILGLTLVVLFYSILSEKGAAFYNEPRLVPILNTLSLYLFFVILSIVPRAILMRNLNFKALVKISILGSVVSSVTAIIMAFLNFGVWSLVAKYLVDSVIVLLSYWFKIGWRPDFKFKGNTLTNLAGYSVFIQANGMLAFFRTHIDYLIIGKLVSAHVLGIYTLAYTLSEVLRTQIYNILNKVFFPVFSNIQDDIVLIKDYYLKTIRFTSIITFPVSVFFIGLAQDFIPLVFGEKWIESVTSLKILSFASMIFSISGTPAIVLKSIGKPNVSFYLNFFNTLFVAFPLIYFGLKYYGIEGVAVAVCIHYTTSRIVFHNFMIKHINLTNKDVYFALQRPIIASISMFAAIYIISLVILNPLINLILASIIGFGVFAIFFVSEFQLLYSMVVKKKIKYNVS
jgi:O-antigen/teichoic acid export membrane protein